MCVCVYIYIYIYTHIYTKCRLFPGLHEHNPLNQEVAHLAILVAISKGGEPSDMVWTPQPATLFKQDLPPSDIEL